MCLAADVLHPQRGNVLLKWGFPLHQGVIDKLREHGIREVWVKFPGTDAIREYISPAILQKRGEVLAMIAELFDQVHVEAHVKLQYDHYMRILRNLIEAMISDTNASAYIIEMGGCARSELRHGAEVAFLSILLGLKLQGYLIEQRRRLAPNEARDVSSLGLGAMLHDVGYITLDRAVRDRYHRSGDQTDQAWQQHVTTGYSLLSGSVRPAAACVILQHHQNYDGSGFPLEADDQGVMRGMVGQDIHVFARIANVANVFDRLLNPADGSPPPPRVRVLRQMLSKPMNSRFDPVVLAALPMVVPAYPPGAMVRLSNGQQGVVVKWNPRTPCQPVVQPLPDDALKNPREHTCAAGHFDLRERTDLVIVEQDGVDVRQDNFRLATKAEHAQFFSGTAADAPGEKAA